MTYWIHFCNMCSIFESKSRPGKNPRKFPYSNARFQSVGVKIHSLTSAAPPKYGVNFYSHTLKTGDSASCDSPSYSRAVCNLLSFPLAPGSPNQKSPILAIISQIPWVLK